MSNTDKLENSKFDSKAASELVTATAVAGEEERCAAVFVSPMQTANSFIALAFKDDENPSIISGSEAPMQKRDNAKTVRKTAHAVLRKLSSTF